MILQTLDWFFVIFHFILVIFNLTGWIWVKTRFWHLITMGSTMFSWLVLGAFYGLGYCFCTDWHWQVKRKLGETGLPYSYIKYYVDQIFDVSANAQFVDGVTAGVFGTLFIVTIVLNVRGRKSGSK